MKSDSLSRFRFTQISVKAIATDLRNHVSDQQLMIKYNLTDNALERVFEMLLTAMSKGASHIWLK